MARGTRMELSGIPEALAALRELPKATEKPIVRKAMIHAAQPMVLDAASRVPVAEGDLRDAMIASSRIVPGQAKDSRKPGKEGVRAFVGPNYSKTTKGKGYAPHAHIVEFGTGPRWHKSKKYVGQMPAQPFMRPAFDAGKVNYINTFGASLLQMIETAAQRIARKNARLRK